MVSMMEMKGGMLENVEILEETLEWRVTGAQGYREQIQRYEENYKAIRNILLKYHTCAIIIPEFIKNCRHLNEAHDFIRHIYPTYRKRREFIRRELRPLLDLFEQENIQVDDISKDQSNMERSLIKREVLVRTGEKMISPPNRSVSVSGDIKRSVIVTGNKNIVKSKMTNPKDNEMEDGQCVFIGVITALPKEYAAVEAFLENPKRFDVPGRGAGRRYLLGDIPAVNGGRHTIALSLANIGNNIAAARATLLLEHFPAIRSIIMVGIAGGVPYSSKPEEHVRLGDIVVSDGRGIIQYDMIKEEVDKIIHRYPPRPPSAVLLEAVQLLMVGEFKGERPWLEYIDNLTEKLGISRPLGETDVLIESFEQGGGRAIIPHPLDPERIENKPRVFTGPIAAANTLLKDPVKRDRIRDKFGAKAVEMESSGIADATWNHESGYLAIRGICDYCDKNKGNEWQKYAAVAAAGYLKALIESLPV
jgi:nucleoside phosphorylase